MSFSGEVREELSAVSGKSRPARLAELFALMSLCGGIRISASERYSLGIQTENLPGSRKFAWLVQRVFGVSMHCRCACRKAPGGGKGQTQPRSYAVAVGSHADAVNILQEIQLLTGQMELVEYADPSDIPFLQKTESRRAFLRGAFLAAGSLSDPHRSYHLEIIARESAQAGWIQAVMKTFGLEGRLVERKNHEVVYLKEGSQVSDMLSVMEAHRAMMEFENIRILREINNDVNRQVNCEMANIHKTVSAAVRQVEDIRYIAETVGLYALPPALEQTARMRLQFPELSLSELGEKLEPPVGKSGVNHRLRSLAEVAQRLRRGEMPEELKGG